jgi:hypothetical protein
MTVREFIMALNRFTPEEKERQILIATDEELNMIFKKIMIGDLQVTKEFVLYPSGKPVE